jgi:NAD(P)-dependent dehydrogenase (short-subunit alcohol dehydrogenase family)
MEKFGNIIPLRGDVTSKDDLKRLAAHVEAEVGHLDIFVANAGISGPDLSGLSSTPSLLELRDKLWSPSIETFADTYMVNACATFFSVIAFLELLDKGNKKNGSQRSQVVAVSSISGFNRNVPGGFAYGGSKAATTQMMKQFATVLSPYGIRSNVIAPGSKCRCTQIEAHIDSF